MEIITFPTANKSQPKTDVLIIINHALLSYQVPDKASVIG